MYYCAHHHCNTSVVSEKHFGFEMINYLASHHYHNIIEATWADYCCS